MDRKAAGRVTRIIAGGASEVLLAIVCLCLAGLRINGTQSFPVVGVFWALNRPVRKGDMVFVDPPASPIFELAPRRGYLDAGYSPAGSCSLIKRVAGVPGDRAGLLSALLNTPTTLLRVPE